MNRDAHISPRSVSANRSRSSYYRCTGVANGMGGSKSSSSQYFLTAPFEKIHSCSFKYSSSMLVFLRTETGCSSEEAMNNGF